MAPWPVPAADDGKAITREPDSAGLEWGPCPAFMPDDCGIAVLHGDPAQPNADVFFRLAGNTIAPRHWHTSAERMVLVSGKMEVDYDDQEPVVLRPGTYLWPVPAPAHKPLHIGRGLHPVHRIRRTRGRPCRRRFLKSIASPLNASPRMRPRSSGPAIRHPSRPPLSSDQGVGRENARGLHRVSDSRHRGPGDGRPLRSLRESRASAKRSRVRVRSVDALQVGHSLDRPPNTQGTRDIRSAVSRMPGGALRHGA
jgi:hypothetical protein